MPVGYLRALGLLHQTFHTYPPAARLHILGRFLSCPFLRTLDVVPVGARVLDIGAGHGTFARLAVEERAAEVIAVDPDLRKTLHAYRHPKVRFVAGFDDAIRGEFDVVSMFDVLYRLSPEQRDALFARILERLKPGGLFLLKEVGRANGLKHVWNRTQELISDNLFGLTVGEGFYVETDEELRVRMERAGFTGFAAKRIDRGYPHAHTLYTAHRP